MKGVILEDSPLLGEGRLSEKVITKVQEYYGHAVRNNCIDLNNMIRTI